MKVEQCRFVRVGFGKDFDRSLSALKEAAASETVQEIVVQCNSPLVLIFTPLLRARNKRTTVELFFEWAEHSPLQNTRRRDELLSAATTLNALQIPLVANVIVKHGAVTRQPSFMRFQRELKKCIAQVKLTLRDPFATTGDFAAEPADYKLAS